MQGMEHAHCCGPIQLRTSALAWSVQMIRFTPVPGSCRSPPA
jgi:hypothetical protein